jgi:Tol biopolymer transport system component
MKPKFAYLIAFAILISACGSQPAASQPAGTLPPAATETTAAPTEAPAREAIAFYTNRDDGDFEIYVMNPDGSDPINLTNTEGFDAQPAWSPDGTRIVFASGRNGDSEFPPANEDIYLMNADGSGLVRLTENQIPDSDPAWSPDGTQIAFVSRLEVGYQIFIMNADGSSSRNFTNDTFDNLNPAWSPDGTQIAFASDREPNDPIHSTEIFVINVDGSGLTRLTSNTTFDDTPVWSPDGTKIAFNCDAEICVMKADGSNLRDVTNRPDSGEYLGSWSPDGTQLVFDSDMDTFAGEIYLLDLATGEVTRLTNNEFGDDNPVWFGR